MKFLKSPKLKPQRPHASLGTSIYDVQLSTLTGSTLDLNSFKGRKILFVNVASKCGFTQQYKALEELYQTYKNELVIVGLPCNQFGNQEPGNAQEIQSFCERNYGVTFPITEKVKVKGHSQHPLYQWLTQKELNRKKNSKVRWNFQKYLVDENGDLVDYFYSTVSPMSTKITKHLQ